MIIAVANPRPSGIDGSSGENVRLLERHVVGLYGPRATVPVAVAMKSFNTEPAVKFEPVSVSVPPITIGCAIGSRTGGPGGGGAATSVRQVAPLSTGAMDVLLQGENLRCSDALRTGFMMYVAGEVAQGEPSCA